MPTRLLTLDDVPALTDLLERNREHLAATSPHRDGDWLTVERQREAAVHALAEHTAGRRVPMVILDAAGELAGTLNLNSIIRGAFQSASVGYWVSADRTGRGLATAAVADALALAFGPLALHRVQGETQPANVASQRVLLRNGFVEYGRAPQYLHLGGAWRDCVLFQRLSTD
ncbi:GNAT family protein [Oryzihumus sp.]|uniref:GNAT family N-acetyltransferase n=1 Tax=Oryzihumus sp. TaxID=1968903 RepID=UPI002ED8675E